MTKKEIAQKIYMLERNNPMGVYYGHFSKNELLSELEDAEKRATREYYAAKLRCDNGVTVLGKGRTMEQAIFGAKKTAKKTGLIVRSIWIKKGEDISWKKI